ncbi:hypothetical protein TW95_gp1693 [Pandoravirus inopinatum]|uniref:Uncharacterized protein n=1 Tax=Pandoravirus inopinatum TaxID=1605721 RepID=A0A0B5JF21_9VIRU|nr:hypothetical protein TW95_gp1693 [Pandoravirus inopinatum]AJF98427.1 hypothetical protein [Pandoravirus inopinatum]
MRQDKKESQPETRAGTAHPQSDEQKIARQQQKKRQKGQQDRPSRKAPALLCFFLLCRLACVPVCWRNQRHWTPSRALHGRLFFFFVMLAFHPFPVFFLSGFLWLPSTMGPHTSAPHLAGNPRGQGHCAAGARTPAARLVGSLFFLWP